MDASEATSLFRAGRNKRAQKNRLQPVFLSDLLEPVRELVGATGFEPATFSSRTRRATKLRYAPKMAGILQKKFCFTSG